MLVQELPNRSGIPFYRLPNHVEFVEFAYLVMGKIQADSIAVRPSSSVRRLCLTCNCVAKEAVPWHGCRAIVRVDLHVPKPQVLQPKKNNLYRYKSTTNWLRCIGLISATSSLSSRLQSQVINYKSKPYVDSPVATNNSTKPTRYPSSEKKHSRLKATSPTSGEVLWILVWTW